MAAMPAPQASAITRSTARRSRAGSSTSRAIASDRFGSQRRPSSRSTVVTISTRSWVTARSAAENQTKVTQVRTPAPPSSASAAKR